MANNINRFLGDSLGRTILKLLVISFIVGIVMNTMGWYPADIFNGIYDFIIRVWETGFAAFGRFGQYLLLGGAVVIPAFIVLRILSHRKS